MTVYDAMTEEQRRLDRLRSVPNTWTMTEAQEVAFLAADLLAGGTCVIGTELWTAVCIHVDGLMPGDWRYNALVPRTVAPGGHWRRGALLGELRRAVGVVSRTYHPLPPVELRVAQLVAFSRGEL